MDVLGELIVRPTLDDDGDRRRADGHRRGDPLATSTTRPSTPRSCSSRRCSATGRSAARSAATRTASGRCPSDDDPRASGGRCTGRPTPSSPSPATSTTTRRSTWPARRSGPATARSRASRRRPTLPAGERALLRARRDATQAQLIVGVPGAPPRPSRTRGSSRCSTRSSATGCRAGCSCRSARRRAWPTTSSSGLVDYADAGLARGLGRRRSRAAAGGPRGGPRRARPAARRAGPGRRAGQGEGVPVRRPGAADGRDPPPRVVDRRPGGAPRSRPDARRGARRGRRRRRRRTSSGWPASCSATTGCAWRSSPRPVICAASSAACGCRHDGLGARPSPPRRPAGSPADRRPRRAIPTSSWPGSICGSARSASPGPSSRRWPAAARSTTTAIRDLAEARWRTGDMAGAGEAAAAWLETHPDDVLAPRDRRRGAGATRPAERGAAARRPGAGASRRLARPDLRRDAAELDLAGRGGQRAAGRSGVLFDDLHPGPTLSDRCRGRASGAVAGPAGGDAARGGPRAVRPRRARPVIVGGPSLWGDDAADAGRRAAEPSTRRACSTRARVALEAGQTAGGSDRPDPRAAGRAGARARRSSICWPAGASRSSSSSVATPSGSSVGRSRRCAITPPRRAGCGLARRRPRRRPRATSLA